MKSVKTVNEYIENSPKETRVKLKEIRNIIKKSVPQAEEKISYGMPYYGYKGRLVYFRLSKNHIGLYIPPPIIQNFKNELKNYETAMATVRFPINKKLPVTLIKKLVCARAEFNRLKQKISN